MDKCKAKVESLEELLTHYKYGDHNSMESKQTNVGIFIRLRLIFSSQLDCGWAMEDIFIRPVQSKK